MSQLIESEELEERSDQKLTDRQDNGHDEEEQAECEGRPAPSAERDQARGISLPRHRLVVLVAEQPPAQQDEQQHQPHDHEAHRRRELVARLGILGDRL